MQWTMTGKPVPELAQYDVAVKALMAKYDVRAASLAIGRTVASCWPVGTCWLSPNMPRRIRPRPRLSEGVTAEL
jgi:hypothetical protein